jgi:DNA-binding beta-propeller fold protein YncE
MTQLRAENRRILTGTPSSLRLVPVLVAGLILALQVQAKPRGGTPGVPIGHFVPVATYNVSGDVAEIVAATPDGNYLIYTDSGEEEVGVVDITDPTDPTEVETVELGGQPTCVAITPDGRHALIGIYDGRLLVIDLVTASQTTIDLGGQPDSVAVSPDGRYAAIAIENERDENLNDGEMPQDPPGWLTIVDLVGQPSAWTLRTVSLLGLGRFPTDPEPEFVSIREENIAAVTLQENNYVALVDLVPLSGNLIGGFSAGTTTHLADLADDDLISFTELLADARLEPDAIGWTPQGNLVTANEGDYDLDADFVGGRNFTIFAPDGTLLFDCGPELEMVTAAAGYYDDGRSDNKGTEPEGIEIARYLNHTFMFVGMERADSVAVYRIDGNESRPRFVQVLGTGERPEGLLAIPQRGLFISANEDDGTISIFEGRPENP